MASILLPLCVLFVGILVYGLPTGRAQSPGLVAFGVGLLWCIFILMHVPLRF